MKRQAKTLFFLGAFVIAAASRTSHANKTPSALPASPAAQTAAFTQALALYDAGDLVRAAEALTANVRRADASGNHAHAIRARAILAETYAMAGHYKLATYVLESGFERARSENSTQYIAELEAAAGNVCMLTRDANRSRAYLDKALVAAESEGDEMLLATIQINLGNLLLARQEFAAAEIAYQSAHERADRLGHTGVASKSLANLARCRLASGDMTGAEEANRRAARILVDSPGSHNTCIVQILVGHTFALLAAHLADRADTFLSDSRLACNAAAAMATRLQDRTALCYALGNLGYAHEQQGDVDTAVSITRRAAFIAQEEQLPDALYRWQWQLGRLFREQTKIDQAEQVLSQAVATLQTIRHDVAIRYGNANLHSSFRQAVGDLYLDLADVRLQQSDYAATPEAATRKRLDARDTIEQLRAAELDDYFQDDCVNIARSHVRPADTVQDGSAVVYIIPLRDRIEFIVTLPSGLKRFTQQVTSIELTRTVRDYRRFLQRRTTREYMRPAQTLHKWLIDPIESAVAAENVRTLVFVPYGALLTVPFSALHDGDAFLIAKYAVAIIPGLSLMDPTPIESAPMRILKCGLSEGVQGFPPLPFVSTELNNIQEIFSDGKVLQDQAFVDSHLTKAFAETPYSIVHIATHGEFGRDARDTFLLTYDDRLDLNRLESLLRPNAYRGQPVELLTLSACQTAAGDDRAALGLAGVAFKAGARSVLATLWYINDEAASILIRDFYQRLSTRSAGSKVEALRQSQLALLQDLRYRHPCYWSPYLMIGNWL